MPLPIALKTGFKATVLTDAGKPLQGVNIRLLDYQNEDVTAQLFLNTPPITDSFGVASLTFFLPRLPAGSIYRIQFTKSGWEPVEIQTEPNPTFTGSGTFAVTMHPLPVGAIDFTLEDVPPLYVSAIYPIDFIIQTTQTAQALRIETTVNHSSGVESVIESVIGPDGRAIVDIHNRIRLKPLPVFVPEGEIALVDGYFSDIVTVSMQAVTESVSLPVVFDDEGAESFELYVANSFPLSFTNDLREHVTPPAASWITLFEEPVCFPGYYLDVMVWLPDVFASYALSEVYYNKAGAELSRDDTFIQGSPKVQRIRVKSDVEPEVSYVLLQVYGSSGPITKPLKVNYQHAY